MKLTRTRRAIEALCTEVQEWMAEEPDPREDDLAASLTRRERVLMPAGFVSGAIDRDEQESARAGYVPAADLAERTRERDEAVRGYESRLRLHEAFVAAYDKAEDTGWPKPLQDACNAARAALAPKQERTCGTCREGRGACCLPGQPRSDCDHWQPRPTPAAAEPAHPCEDCPDVATSQCERHNARVQRVVAGLNTTGRLVRWPAPSTRPGKVGRDAKRSCVGNQKRRRLPASVESVPRASLERLAIAGAPILRAQPCRERTCVRIRAVSKRLPHRPSARHPHPSRGGEGVIRCSCWGCNAATEEQGAPFARPLASGSPSTDSMSGRERGRGC